MGYARTLVPIILCGMAGAATAAERFNLVGEVDDVLVDEPRVNADAVVIGLVRYGSARGDGTAAEILAAVPKSWGPKPVICVWVRTQDGLYSGHASFEPEEDWEPGELAAMSYVTDKARLFDYPPGEVAVLATPGACDAPVEVASVDEAPSVDGNPKIPGFATVTWQAAEEAPPEGEVHLLLNSFRADEVYLIIGDHEVGCEPVDGGSRASFDTRCAIPADLLDDDPDIIINRLRGNSSDLPITVRAAGP